jgi:hypothetical protein
MVSTHFHTREKCIETSLLTVYDSMKVMMSTGNGEYLDINLMKEKIAMKKN